MIEQANWLSCSGYEIFRSVTINQLIIRYICPYGNTYFSVIVFMVRENYPFTDEGKNLLIEEFGKNYATIKFDYPTYSGRMLERYFKQQLAESFQYRAIGSWWEPKGDQNEIDIVALKLEKNQALVAEVKRQRKNFKPELLSAWNKQWFASEFPKVSNLNYA